MASPPFITKYSLRNTVASTASIEMLLWSAAGLPITEHSDILERSSSMCRNLFARCRSGIIALLSSSWAKREQVIHIHTRRRTHTSAMLRGMSISRLELAPLSLARLHRRISFLSTSMERLASCTKYEVHPGTVALDWCTGSVVVALQFFRVSIDPCADILAMLFRPVADSTKKLRSSNISAAAHLVASVYKHNSAVRGPSSITPRSGGGVDTLEGIVLQFSQASSASHVLLAQLIARVICMNKRIEAGHVSATPTLFQLQQKNNSGGQGRGFHIHDGDEYEYSLDSTQRGQPLHLYSVPSRPPRPL
ncbi:uncharacterized protein TRIVIDRAFT_197094 [Trichoderma virens Gv29-8]|uniref:Uncharacterized protein n=1 Tax=Hypocrea virens (strain Gv29-8 / FGSC 10586) TaxID=413071 RepID=G9MDS3_HYPVG|nr:uncharacterized protein TRIVIDRAFT_197094 [Trichoderma virens Gv29-8]EHK27232.1 hypothetical protein TRIVIDRAFT_197094 [Trichoderma virens Gv29-8]UKZ57694.1 hypothetical protein TrVGV298_011554 [Trichoderma virens]